MNTIENIENRRSIKHYDAAHVMPEADLAELIRVTKLAPTSFNMQNYRLLVVRDPDIRKQLRAAAWDQAQLTEASVVFLMCSDLEAHSADPALYWGHAPQEVLEMVSGVLKPFYEGNEQLIRDEGIRSSSFAGMTLMLAARELGYDTCPMVGYDANKVAEIVNLPENMLLNFIITVGKGSKPAWERGPRLPDEKVVAYDRF